MFTRTPKPPISDSAPLHAAARKGQWRQLRAILRLPQFSSMAMSESRASARVLLNAPDVHGRTPLHIAAWYGNFRCVRMLLEHPDIQVHARDEQQRSPIQLAMEWKHAACIKLLVWAGACNPRAIEER